jgi:mRNA-degrading endonuclease RelE of RelBE toxin-antitoxin system
VPQLSKRAQRDLDELPEVLQEKARALIEQLDSQSHLGKKLLGTLSGKRSLRLGRTHRIIYSSEPTVFIIAVTPRKDAYR